MDDGLLHGGRDELEALFDELAEELDVLGVLLEILMVGGSWLLWFGERDATRDVDSARPVSDRPECLIGTPTGNRMAASALAAAS